MTELNNKFNFLVKEYEKLKDEQHKRIEFRDQMIFITLGAIGGVFSFVVDQPDYVTALLVLPFVCVVLGWTYLTNDERISEIGDYCQKNIIPKIESTDLESKIKLIPSWEEFHRKAPGRKQRKITQVIIDLSIFCLSALFSIAAFFYLNRDFSTIHILLAILQSLFVLYLVYQFIRASFRRLKS